LIGHFGERDETQWPTKISVIGELNLFNNVANKVISAKGLELSRDAVTWAAGNAQYGLSMSYTSPPVMLQAWAYEFSDLGEQHNNHCQKEFPTTTHVIKVLFSGPFTKNGVHALLPTDRDFFTINRAVSPQE